MCLKEVFRVVKERFFDSLWDKFEKHNNLKQFKYLILVGSDTNICMYLIIVYLLYEPTVFLWFYKNIHKVISLF